MGQQVIDWAEHDASRIIEIAREVPLAGTIDPVRLQLGYDWQKSYIDSPELPARRIATEWEDFVDGVLEEKLPPTISRFGYAGAVWDLQSEQWGVCVG
jgi:hypothetical protein